MHGTNDLGLSRATVNQAIQELQSVGLITIERRGKMMTNRYILRDQDLSEE
jgi:uncharacterized membrane protein